MTESEAGGEPAGAHVSRRVLIGVVSGVLLVGVAVWAVTYLVRYQPLRHGSWWTIGSPAGTLDQLIDEEEDEFLDDDEELVSLRYQHRGLFTYAFSLRNSGPFAVMIVDLPFELSLLQPLEVLVRDPAGAPGAMGPARPLRPFQLAAGEERILHIRGRFDHCHLMGGGSSARKGFQAVRFRAITFVRDVSIRLPVEISVAAPGRPGEDREVPREGCPLVAPLEGAVPATEEERDVVRRSFILPEVTLNLEPPYEISVTSRDEFEYRDCVAAINVRGDSRPYYSRSPIIRPGHVVDLAGSSFLTVTGEAWDPRVSMLRRLRLECDTPRGLAVYDRRFPTYELPVGG